MKKSDVYVRFLNLARALEVSEYALLDANLKHLFQYVVLRIDNEQTTTVTELIQTKILGSPATIHSRIQRLIQLGYFILMVDSSDARIKHVVLGGKGEEYIESLSQTFTSLLRG